MRNREVANLLYEIAELLSLTEENPFRIRAYEKAAQAIEGLPQAIEEIARLDKLHTIPGIGESIAEKIKEYLSTNKIQYLEDLKKELPEGLLEIIALPGMGPKKAKLIYDKLKIATVKQLQQAAKQAKLRNLPGFGAKTEENILRSIELKEKSKGRILLYDALQLSNAILSELRSCKEIDQISPAGSLRRKKETIGDIDIFCTVKKGKEKTIIDRFTTLPQVEKVLAAGETKASIISHDGIQVDLRVVDQHCYGAALQYFTGSKEHNIALRELANKKGLTISEYGVFKIGDKTKPVAGKTEEEVYKILGMKFIPPELRENRGEINAAMKDALPQLVELHDIKGDTHVHSNYSDGNNTIEEIAKKTQQMNLAWVIICDHSQSLKVAKGTSIKDVYKKIAQIKKFNEQSKDVKLLAGQEVDILSDGSLDYPDDLLKLLDYVIVAIHTGFKQTEEQITNRILKAFDNKYVHALSHPSGRLLGKRSEYAINMDKVLEAAKQRNIILEINAYPERLDLSDIYCKRAKEMNIMLSIGTDAHNISQMDFLSLGVYVARKGWLEKQNLLNTLPYDKLIRLLNKMKT